MARVWLPRSRLVKALNRNRELQEQAMVLDRQLRDTQFVGRLTRIKLHWALRVIEALTAGVRTSLNVQEGQSGKLDSLFADMVAMIHDRPIDDDDEGQSGKLKGCRARRVPRAASTRRA